MRSSGFGPSMKTRSTGILGPGDGPVRASNGVLLDFRNVHVPKELAALAHGVFPLGVGVHPQGMRAGTPCFLDWGDVAGHVLVVAGSQSGKTYNITLPWALAAISRGIPTVVVDVKGTLYDDLVRRKADLGITERFPLRIWSIGDARRSWSWNPLAEVRQPQDVAALAEAVLGEVDQNSPHKFFAERDHRWLRGLINLVRAREREPTLEKVYELTAVQSDLIDAIRQYPHAASDLVDTLSLSASEYSLAFSGLANRLSWVTEDDASEATAGRGRYSFSVDEFFRDGGLLIIEARQSQGEPAQMAAALMLNMLRLRALGMFGQQQSVLWLLDEAPTYADRIRLPTTLDLVAGAGVAVVVICQSVAQFGSDVARDRAVANIKTFIGLRGMAQASAEWMSEAIGQWEAPTVTSNYDGRGRSNSVSSQPRPILGPTELMNLPVGERGAVVLARGRSRLPWLVTFDSA